MARVQHKRQPQDERQRHGGAFRQGECPVPLGPKTASPVPWLTSIHATKGRGRYGDASYRGNCSGLLIRDLLSYYRPRRVLDPMCGSGTCADVCRELDMECRAHDLRRGFDATKPAHFANIGQYDFVWMHPPYWNVIRYGDDPQCLSNSKTVSDFLRRLRAAVHNCVGVLAQGGHVAILMGDCKHEGEYLGLPFLTLGIAKTEGLWLAAPEIIRFSHGATSSAKRYNTSFIPRLHDVCLVLKRR